MWEAQAFPSMGHQIRKMISSVTGVGGEKNSSNKLQRPQADDLQIHIKHIPDGKFNEFRSHSEQKTNFKILVTGKGRTSVLLGLRSSRRRQVSTDRKL